jgi:putative NIF3 family GTP cyclohydrolase 1 type 2
MNTTVQTFLDALDRIAPLRAARSWDRVGLQMGSPGQRIERVFVALEASPQLLERLSPTPTDLLLTYHPLFVRPIESLRLDSPVGQTARMLLNAGCALIACHTALDASPLGPNTLLARLLDLQNQEILCEPLCAPSAEVKFVVFVPLGHEPAIIDAIAAGGGGVIGQYSHCTFRSPGTGTYKPLEGANPWAGEVGKFESAEEVRLEARVPRERLAEVFQRVRAAHPYEEMACDVVPLEEVGRSESAAGVVGELPEGLNLEAVAGALQEGVGGAPVIDPSDTNRLPLLRVAICLGADRPALLAALQKRIDAMVTDSLGPTDVLLAKNIGVARLALPYFATRTLALRRLHDSLWEMGLLKLPQITWIGD